MIVVNISNNVPNLELVSKSVQTLHICELSHWTIISVSDLNMVHDTKLFRKTKKIGDKQNVHDDIDKLVRWSEKWQMVFNFGKCKCLHTGPGNTGMNYDMGGTILSKTVKEKYLGVTMNANMKVSEQCRIAASKCNEIL